MSSPGEVANLLMESESAVALTGAGLSAPVIPTFRDPDSGVLWRDVDAMQLAHREAFDKDADHWYEAFFWPFYNKHQSAGPTLAHYALSEMVNASVIDSVLTQNIDGLDLLAGTPSGRLFEMHGNDRYLGCTKPDCSYGLPMEELLIAGQPEKAPHCPRDNKPLKPDVLLFGKDRVPGLRQVYFEGQLAVAAADTLLVIGTSFSLKEITDMVLNFAKRGGALAVIDPNPTPVDDYARLVVRTTADEALPELRDLTVGQSA